MVGDSHSFVQNLLFFSFTQGNTTWSDTVHKFYLTRWEWLNNRSMNEWSIQLQLMLLNQFLNQFLNTLPVDPPPPIFWLPYKIFRLCFFLQPSGLEVVVGKITAAQDLLCSQVVYDLEQCLPSFSSSQTISFKLISWAIIHFSSRMSTLLTNI